jgi:hypothetical protein
MPRKLDNWLHAYADYTTGTESPPIFHLWVALGTIAAAAERKVYMDAGYYQVYSNMFIILTSPAGRSRKSTALRIGKRLLKGIEEYGREIHFSTQASSVAALVSQFSRIQNPEHQSLSAYISELGSMLGSKSIEMTDFLTDIYDCNPDWDKQTIGRGLEKIEKPWFNLLAGTTPQWMGENLSKTAVEGGFVSRSIFVYEDTRLRVAFPEITPEQREIERELVHDLAHISEIKGEFRFSPSGREFYREWYEDQDHLMEAKDYRIAGYFERKHVHVLKVAMAVSLAASDELLLTPSDIGTALQLLEELEPGMYKAFSSVGKNIYSADHERIKAQILGSGDRGVSYKMLLRSNIHAIDKDQIDRILSTLVEMGEAASYKSIWYERRIAERLAASKV